MPRLPLVTAVLRRALPAVGLAAWMALGMGSAQAALKPGDVAPDFSTQAALGGEPFDFSLAAALKKGPVVLYFYPKAFTSGCTVEAHLFAEATPQFKALGATVMGLSNDDIATLKKFSVEACRNQFAVGADAGAKLMRAYDAKLLLIPDTADRISYLIGQDGRIKAVHASLKPEGHVQAMLQALQQLQAKP